MTNSNDQPSNQKTNRLITLKEAAQIVGKSELTIRRLVKAKKVNSQKQKTATGFSYLVDEDDLKSFYNLDQLDQSSDKAAHTQQPDHDPDQTINQTGDKVAGKASNQGDQKDDQATGRDNLLTFLQDENSRLREDLKSVRQRREEREEGLTNELGQLKSQVGYFKGVVDTQKKRIEYLLAEKSTVDEEKPPKPTREPVEEPEKDKQEVQNRKKTKIKTILIWLGITLILVFLAFLIYYVTNDHKLL